MILARVLVAKSVEGHPMCRVPPVGYDTTDNGNKEGIYRSIVKYDDFTFHPEYVISYNYVYNFF